MKPALLLLSVVAPWLSACSSGSCTNIGCGGPTIDVQFVPPITAPGVYTFTVQQDGEEVSSCDMTFDPQRTFTIQDCGSFIVAASRAKPTPDVVRAFEISGFELRGSDRVSITVLADGSFLAGDTFEPKYKGIEINGPGCGECPRAVQEVALLSL
jgi:hypothetical protein